MKLKITHLYPDLLSFYGDTGNIEALRHRLIWRGIDAEVNEIKLNDDIDLSDTDILFLGGGGEREEKIVMEKLRKYRDSLLEYIENDGVVLAVCGGFDMLGKYVKYSGETVEGAGVLDIYTEESEKRITGDVVLEASICDGKIVGFENRTALTDTRNITPLGKVLYGTGTTEGAVYKNVVATHLHGPLLPKNPKLCDYLLEKALQKKYMEFHKLSPLSAELENQANEFIVKRYL